MQDSPNLDSVLKGVSGIEKQPVARARQRSSPITTTHQRLNRSRPALCCVIRVTDYALKVCWLLCP